MLCQDLEFGTRIWNRWLCQTQQIEKCRTRIEKASESQLIYFAQLVHKQLQDPSLPHDRGNVGLTCWTNDI